MSGKTGGGVSRRQFMSAMALAAGGAAVAPMSISYGQEKIVPGKVIPPLLMESYPDQLTVEATRVYARELAKLGIRIKHKPMGFGPIIGKVYIRHKLMTAMMGFGSSEDRVDPDFYLRNVFSTGGFFNASGYSNPEYDRLIKAQLQELDLAKRKKFIADAQRIFAKDLPSWWVCGRALINPVNTRLFTNIKPSKAMALETYQLAPYLEMEPKTNMKEVSVATLFRMSSAHLFTERAGNGRGLLRFVYDTFLRYDQQLKLNPWAAESYKIVDPVTVDLKIRDGMKWHDGKPVTADDAEFTFNYVLKWKPARWAGMLAPIKSAEKVGPSTVRVHLKGPSATFFTVSLAQITILPKHIWKDVPEKYGVKTPDEWNMAKLGPIGSGAYKFDYFKKDVDLHVVANRDHWSGGPKLDGIHYIQGSSVEQIKGGMETESIHIIADGITLPDGKRLAEKPFIDLFVTNASTLISFYLDMRKPLFQDLALRQAMYHATPKQKVLDIVLGGAGQVARRSPIPPVFDEWIPADIPGDEYDIEKSKKILADAGYTWDRSGNLIMRKA